LYPLLTLSSWLLCVDWLTTFNAKQVPVDENGKQIGFDIINQIIRAKLEGMVGICSAVDYYRITEAKVVFRGKYHSSFLSRGPFSLDRAENQANPKSYIWLQGHDESISVPKHVPW